MLVLLVIFIVTAPLLSHSVKLELPKASAQPVQVKAETNASLELPQHAPEVFTDVGFWGARISSETLLIANLFSGSGAV